MSKNCLNYYERGTSSKGQAFIGAIKLVKSMKLSTRIGNQLTSRFEKIEQKLEG